MTRLVTLLEQHLDWQSSTVVIQATTWQETVLASASSEGVALSWELYNHTEMSSIVVFVNIPCLSLLLVWLLVCLSWWSSPSTLEEVLKEQTPGVFERHSSFLTETLYSSTTYLAPNTIGLYTYPCLLTLSYTSKCKKSSGSGHDCLQTIFDISSARTVVSMQVYGKVCYKSNARYRISFHPTSPT